MDIEEFRRKFLVKSRLDVIPDDVYYAFINKVNGDEEQLREAWELGQKDSQLLKFKIITLNQDAYVILRDVEFEPIEEGILITLGNNFYAKMSNIENSLIEKIQNGYVLLKLTRTPTTTDPVTKKKVYAEVKEIYSLSIKNKIERAKEIDEFVKDDRRTALVEMLGYNFNEVISTLTIHRLLGVFTIGEKVQPPVIAQFTTPNSGKTSFGKKMLLAANWDYFNSMPSEARLIWNAKTDAPGAVVRHDGIIFDEFDKYTFNTEDGKKFFSNILTGISHGIWSRSKGNTKDIQKQIPMIFFGNVDPSLIGSGNARDYFKELLKAKKVKDAVDPFIERITSPLVYASPVNANEYVSGYQATAVDLKAYLTYLNELIREEYRKIAAKDDSPFEGRLKLHYIYIKAALTVIEGDVKDETVQQLVEGPIIS